MAKTRVQLDLALLQFLYDVVTEGGEKRKKNKKRFGWMDLRRASGSPLVVDADRWMPIGNPTVVFYLVSCCLPLTLRPSLELGIMIAFSDSVEYKAHD